MRDPKVVSLHQIRQLPLDKSKPVYAEYAAFKLGVKRSARHFARQLAPLTRQLVTDNAQYTEWVLTAPALTGAPAGANLLCWNLNEMLREEMPGGTTLQQIDIHDEREAEAVVDPQVLRRHYDYAKLSFEKRVKERERSKHAPDSRFAGRAVLFVNDILVTGAHQCTMKRYFESVGAAAVWWLYLIDVDPEIGKAEPELEWEINYSSFEVFAQLVSQEEIDYTGKCLQKLFHYNRVEFEQILDQLDAARRAKILQLALEERFESVESFQENLELVRLACADDSRAIVAVTRTNPNSKTATRPPAPTA